MQGGYEMVSRNNLRNLETSAKSRVRSWLECVSLITLMTVLVAMSLPLSSCSSGRTVTLGENNIGTIGESDPSEGENDSNRWSYHEYFLDVEADYPYKFTLTTTSGITTGIWSSDKGSWIVEVSTVVRTRTATYRFKNGGKQKLFIEVPASEVPSEYSWYVTR